MALIKITFPDGSSKEFEAGISGFDILKGVPQKVRKQALVMQLNDQIVDLSTTITTDATVQILLPEDAVGMKVFWHSTSHLMAHAVKALFPEAKFGVGPSIAEGFYYDIDVEKPFTPEDLVKIEKKMKELVKANGKFVLKELSHEEAVDFFKEREEVYKLELLEGIDGVVSVYEEGDFADLCSGPHLPSTKYIKHFKLLSSAGAYWRGDEKNPMLQRIYGTSYPNKEMLDDHLFRLEEAKRRDHRRLGKELDLFSINDDIGPGLVLWHPKGAMIRKVIEDFWRNEHLKDGYELLFTPHIARLKLWEISGHLDFYSDNMYSPMLVDEVEYQVKPMNCPFHLAIYKNKNHSYRDLPIRWAELGTVYRYERSGVLHGLMRVRGFTQDDAHIFCRKDQLEDEILRLLDFTFFMLRTFSFKDFDVYLSTRPEKYVGDLDNWELATSVLQKALDQKEIDYEIDPGEGVFYGPKIDIKIRDSLGRSWQCSTIQVDFNEPERFDLTYKGSDGKEHRPIMVHRALLGSLERFFGVLIEHFGGAFPVWLAPIQAIILPITDRQHEFAAEIHAKLVDAGIRSKLDDRNEKVGYKIREAETQKIPYMLVVGEKEATEGTLSIRRHGQGDQGTMDITAFINQVQAENASRQ